MQVILTEDVKKLGKTGDIVEVKDGYARNFLIPKKLAVVANKENIKIAKDKKGSLARQKAQTEDEARLLALQLSKLVLTIPVNVGENGKLFGSVTGKDIADLLQKEHDLKLDKRKISFEQEITGVDAYEANVKVHPNISAKIKVKIVEK